MLCRLAFHIAILASVFAVPAGAACEERRVPARHAIESRAADSATRVRPVDWSGYRGIRRYAYYPYGAYGPPFYHPHPPFYYGHYYHRPWYATPYAYNFTYRYPVYAPRYFGIEPFYSWHGPLAAHYPLPQVSSTLPPAQADETGKFYW